MTPTNPILDAIVNLLGNDVATLAPAALALHVHLSQSNFTPGPGNVPGSFVEANFTGYAALDAGVGACQVFVDPTTGLRTVQLNEPAGGWHWHTTGTTGLPMTIYGFYVTDNTDGTVYGSERFATPIVLSASGQGIDQPYIRFTFLNTSPF